MLSQIDHVGIAVANLQQAVAEYEAAFGLRPTHRERVESQGVDEVLFVLRESAVQLLGALGPDTPVGRFLATRGEGVHHVAYRVDDIERSLEDLRAAGIRLIDTVPRPGSRGTRIAFAHPRAFRGVLVELVEHPRP